MSTIMPPRSPDVSLEGTGEVVSASDYFVDFERIRVKGPDHPLTEAELKDWIWQNHKDELTSVMSIKQESRQSEYERSLTRLRLLDTLAHAQRIYLMNRRSKEIYAGLLKGLLDVMDSEYGFIGEVKYDDDGSMYLQTHAVTNIAWDSATRKFYEENKDAGLEFRNMNSLFGTVLTTREVVISNTPQKDKRGCGIPSGHPPLDHFLGIPFCKGNTIVGMLGIANKPGGYTMEDVAFLEPLSFTCSNLIQAYWQVQKNDRLINTLEEKVTERTNKLQVANERLEEANARVVKASKAQLEHFACMSHEIRTPLNCIIGLTSLLLETKLNLMQQESIKMINTSGDLLNRVVNDVLDYSKLESDNVEIESRRCSLQEILNAIVHSIETKAGSRNLNIRTNYDTDLPEFFTTDGRRLQQILYNLLGNAIKFSRDGGNVDMTVALYSENGGESPVVSSTKLSNANGDSADSVPSGCPFHRQANITETPDSDSKCPFGQQADSIPTQAEREPVEERFIRFTVKDYGKGINRADFTKIFQPFQQASTETERLYGGTGLGLAITAKLTQALGGKIAVDSVEEEWSKFTIDIPFKEKAADKIGISRMLTTSEIILVEKDPVNANLISSLIESFKVQCTICKDMNELEDHVLGDNKEQLSSLETTTFICLVQEDLFDAETYRRLTRLIKSRLFTFGPNYSVQSSLSHFRSVVQVLPIVFMNTISNTKDSSLLITPPVQKINPGSFAGLRVLIAEDNTINQKVLARMLTRLGIKNVDIVDNGKKAVDHAAVNLYDVVLMDMQMPVMDGINACKLILAQEREQPKPKIVFVSAHVSNGFELETTKAGSSGYLPKPFNVQDIEDCFQRLLLVDH